MMTGFDVDNNRYQRFGPGHISPASLSIAWM
jgi:hypothetical protein